MATQREYHFSRIEKAIGYITDNFKNQPGLDEVAAAVHLSPFHFQRLFTDWAGVSPKQFLQYITVEHAKLLLKEQQASVTDAAYGSGLSGTGRLHDLFVHIEGMTPGEYKNGGASLRIRYSFAASAFGPLLIASTAKGICCLSFADDADAALQGLRQDFPHAHYEAGTDTLQQKALAIFQRDWNGTDRIKLHLKGTDFQLKVWQALLRVPMGRVSSYGHIATSLCRPKASRAVGSAVGSNPVAFLIPCHRVIQSTGTLGQYHWGSNRKTAMIGWEAAQVLQS